ncbi:unnamed protein product [Mycena citricolor]|uniref:TOG domain-containing protein n=1 Tax=Mycena citricolor TaxID=2018698 RepID=A0AAD2HJI8_9AGAR|nr:unnamed protein product [Mycena citricolor]
MPEQRFATWPSHECCSDILVDVDVKVDALTKLQAEFEAGIEINDPDGLIQVLKVCLRTSNQHLTTATLSALPPLLPLLVAPSAKNDEQNASSTTSNGLFVDAVILRQLLLAFLSPGGLIERLGDKDRMQVKARESIVILGGFAFRANPPASSAHTATAKSRDGKAHETPLMMFERFLRELGLASKVWKVREQSILTLVHIRRAQPQFPIRTYLTQLVEALEDTDAHVRDSARQSVVELFSGPGVSDGARADLKKELTKKNVRKTIADAVLSKLLGGSVNGSSPHSREGSENGEGAAAPGKAKEYVPPSMALASRRPTVGSATTGISRTASIQSSSSRPPSRAAALDSPSALPTPSSESPDIRPVYIASNKDLENEFAGMEKPFEGKENEHNWADRDRAIQRVRGMILGDVHVRFADTFMAHMKEFIQMSLKTLASLRTTVATNTCALYLEMCNALGVALDPFCETLFTNLLKMAGFTKKLTAQQSQASVTALIEHTSSPPRILLPLLWHGLQEKTMQTRAYCTAHTEQYLRVHGNRAKHSIEASGSLEVLEKLLKKALSDASPAVKDNARTCFWVFHSIWHERGATILGALDPSGRKQLEKACPDPEQVVVLKDFQTPKPAKKSSVAAAIAASRAKAKAIANAPPTLRHQATSTSHASAAPPRRTPSPTVSPRSSIAARPSSPLRTSSSPSTLSPKARVVSSSIVRSTSAEAVPSHHSHSPPSPSEQSSIRRRTSSPLATSTANRASTIRKALKPDPTSPSPRVKNGAVPINIRHSTLFDPIDLDDESLLLAQTVPIPHSDSESEHSVNLMSFSAAFEKYGARSPPPRTKSKSQAQSYSPEVSNALSSGSMDTIPGQPVVEDALRARAEQAESAAERLLELVDDDELQHSTIPVSLLNGSSSNPMPLAPPIKPTHAQPPATPVNRGNIMRQAALFKNSPASNGHAPASLMDVLQNQRHQTGWWLKRKKLLAQKSTATERVETDRGEELLSYITALEAGEADVGTLKKLILLAIENPAADAVSSPLSPEFNFPSSPSPFGNTSHHVPPLHSDIWAQNRSFDRLINALLAFMQPTKTEDEIEYGLIALWELNENQAAYLEGRESDLFSLLLRIRYCDNHNVLEATNTIRDALTTRIEPVYGLTTMHASLKAFNALPHPESSSESTKSSSYAFGLIALGKFVLRLPGEIAEEELPRLKSTLITALNDKGSLVVREAAAAAIIAAQLALRDETHLFALLDGLADEKKNLLTYLFDKHGARRSAGSGPSGIDKLEKEMRRLDTRTSTPPRPQATV